LFRNKKTKIPLIKGANIGPFKIKKPPFIWVDEKKFLEVSKDYKFSRVAWRDVARPNLKNRLIATLIPSNYALGNSLNYIKPNTPEILKYFLLAFLNSSIAEYRIKQLTSNSHINQFIIKQLPIPRLPLNDLAVIQIAKLSKELSESKLNSDDSSRHVKKIDKLFSKIYNFSFEEIQHIEKTVGYENL
jgi:Alw26I/Eco31I/Esp3I family type II restriction m6 adenine DNA methyltransferase